MNALLDHSVMEPGTIPAMDLSGMPKAFQRAYGPTEPFENEFGELTMPDAIPIPYQGNRRINPRARGACRIFATWLDSVARIPRIYGFDSQVEYHHGALTLINPSVAQVQEQFGPILFTGDDGRPANHFIDLMITHHDGRRVAVAVKPTSRLESGRFLRELNALEKTMPSGTADEVVLVTENCFSRADAFNAVMYLRFALCPDPVVEHRLKDVLSAVSRDISICDLAQRCRAGGRAFRPIVRGIFEGQLKKLSPGRINLFTKVQRLQ